MHHLPSPATTSSRSPWRSFPTIPFGDRLRKLGEQLERSGAPHDLASRLAAVAREDTDGDGVANETELLLGHSPGIPGRSQHTGTDPSRTPGRGEFAEFLSGYRWQPFEPVRRPDPPQPPSTRAGIRNPVDAFLAADWQTPGIEAASRGFSRGAASSGLSGSHRTLTHPAEQQAFLADTAPDAL